MSVHTDLAVRLKGRGHAYIRIPLHRLRQVAQRLEDVGTDSSGEKCPVCMAGEMKKIFSLFGTGLDGSADSCAPKVNNRYK